MASEAKGILPQPVVKAYYDRKGSLYDADEVPYLRPTQTSGKKALFAIATRAKLGSCLYMRDVGLWAGRRAGRFAHPLPETP